MPDAVIQVIDATKIYDGRTVLDAIRLDVFRGETLCILGGSGSGKSTLSPATAATSSPSSRASPK